MSEKISEKISEKEICPVINLFSFIGKKWILLIIKSVSDGCMCFSDIEKTLVGINPRILSTRLKELEKNGFVSSHIKANTKNKTIYCLTEKGMCFSQNIKNLEEWMKKWEN
ncbi:MAG: helix-turn-helix domain-containing protein [Candidatus Gracilibacteria bacterium]|nr:helix-turn-helix domain-containing protein [Candidatus Gracilibacteria bacterium]